MLQEKNTQVYQINKFNQVLKDIQTHPLPKVGQGLQPLIEYLDIGTIKTLKFESEADFHAKIELSREGFYVYKNTKARLVLYIDGFSWYLDKYTSLPKYHIYASCDKIKKPHTYVYSNEASGVFKGDTGEHRLNLCKTCESIYYTQFHRNFNLEAFITSKD